MTEVKKYLDFSDYVPNQDSENLEVPADIMHQRLFIKLHPAVLKCDQICCCEQADDSCDVNKGLIVVAVTKTGICAVRLLTL